MSDQTNKFSDKELLDIGAVLTAQAYALLEQYPGDVAMQERATEILKLANKANGQWHERQR
jgi:hypothetical protein